MTVLVRVLPHDPKDDSAAGDAPKQDAGSPRASGPAAFLLSQLAVFKDARVRPNALQILLSMAGLYVYYTYLNPLLVQVIGVPEAALPLALAAYGVMAILSNLSAGVVADRWGSARFRRCTARSRRSWRPCRQRRRPARYSAWPTAWPSAM